ADDAQHSARFCESWEYWPQSQTAIGIPRGAKPETCWQRSQETSGCRIRTATPVRQNRTTKRRNSLVALGLMDLPTVSRAFSDGQRRAGSRGRQYLGNFLLSKGKTKFLLCLKNTIAPFANRKKRSVSAIATVSFVLGRTMRGCVRTGLIIAATVARPVIICLRIKSGQSDGPIPTRPVFR